MSDFSQKELIKHKKAIQLNQEAVIDPSRINYTVIKLRKIKSEQVRAKLDVN